MELNNLKPAFGSTHNSKRVGRGYGSGKGRTATRGYKKKIGFEGGQMPLQRRVPKFGFQNINRVEYKAINLNIIQKLVDDKKLEKVGIAELIEAGFINKHQLVKILANGELTAKVVVEAHAFSKKAEEIITEKGGNVVKL